MNDFSPSHNQNVCSYDHVFELLTNVRQLLFSIPPKNIKKSEVLWSFQGVPIETIGAKWVKESLSLWHVILLCSNFSPCSPFLVIYFLWLMHIIDIWGKTYINTVPLFAISYWIFCLSLYIVPKIKIEWMFL